MRAWENVNLGIDPSLFSVHRHFGGVNMMMAVLGAGHQFQIGNVVVGWVTILMVNLEPWRDRTVVIFPHNAMQITMNWITRPPLLQWSVPNIIPAFPTEIPFSEKILITASSRFTGHKSC